MLTLKDVGIILVADFVMWLILAIPMLLIF